MPSSKDPQPPSKYPAKDGLNFKGVSAPTPLSQLDRVERQNYLAINVYGWEDGRVVSYRLSKVEAAPHTVNLFLVTKGVQHHYTWVKDLNQLLYDQNAHKECKYFCERCLHGYKREDLLEKHKPNY